MFEMLFLASVVLIVLSQLLPDKEEDQPNKTNRRQLTHNERHRQRPYIKKTALSDSFRQGRSQLYRKSA